MKPIVKVALLAATVGGAYLGYTKIQNAPYGIGTAAPIGAFESLDTYLTEDIGLIKSETSNLPVRDIRPTPRMYRYTNRENEYESVTLLLDDSHALQGIVGVYWLGDFGSRSPVMLFSQSYWRRLGGVREPEFTETREGRYTISDAHFQADRVAGTWKEWAEEGQRQVTIHLRGR